MSATSEKLNHLHQLLLRLREVQAELEAGPRQIAARKQWFAKKQAELEDRRQKLKLAKVTADQKNLQLKTNEAKIADLRAKQNTVTTNREYDILRGQIDADTMAKSVLEDEILEALESVDRGQVDVKSFESEVATAEAEVKKFVEQIEAKVPGLKQQAEELNGQVAAAEDFLTDDVKALYRRLVQVHGADALAAVESGSCSNCYVKLTQQMTVEMRSGRLMFCKSCGRLLYLPKAA